MKKLEILLLSFLILIFVFVLNFVFEGKITDDVSFVLKKCAYPFFYLRESLNSLFEKKVEYKLIYLDIKEDELNPLSFSEKGIYFYNINATGVIITDEKKFFGIARDVGKFVFVRKWWYDKFKVTIVTDIFEMEAFHNNGILEFVDNVEVKNGDIFLSKKTPYGVFLWRNNVKLGTIRDGKIYWNIPKLNLKTHFFLLKDYNGRR
ncbi:hypothetical protein SU69_06500 [Thermosipho melanesiensis]|uniref:Uncharacterized protein n=2 Tax=Thermosipho melanesiensis TaxID=46541 RepID=A6LMI1_THEM4|nr:hypothetical protein [Thermosipho melanesiensis]ABR31132.1 hypothetical protein Tmel_1283 [Thermosipho melanesiensis BI429]APT74223.1 hypothetical protein BW47_06820 [Thermosipho melanesiensis]OOC36166.1 hypothetical protein SU68_06570 [Thermosipho melanesiensis]OOC36984.1 hypothetical protein SU69_06500 [Thermosipho melanesiensis]OOC37736.1 hypothetical protein SU70_06510 [Thermosipho melanesiensis]